MFRLIYCIVCYIWIVVFLFTILYLYFKNLKPYKHHYNEEFCVDIPSNLSPAELSILMYQRITASTFSAEIIKILNDGVLLLEEKDGIKYLVKNDRINKNLSKSEDYTIKILLDVMGDGTKVKIDRNNLFSKKKKNCDVLLNEYKIWCRIMRTESVKSIFYEPKSEYLLVKRISIIGFALFIINIIFKLFQLLGYIILIPAFLIILFFLRIYKRTEIANEEYYKWLAFKRYLDNIENFDVKANNINDYLMYGAILNVKGLEKKLTNNDYYEEITNIMNINIIRAILKGNRSL